MFDFCGISSFQYAVVDKGHLSLTFRLADQKIKKISKKFYPMKTVP